MYLARDERDQTVHPEAHQTPVPRHLADAMNSVQDRVASMPPIVLGKDIAEELGRP